MNNKFNFISGKLDSRQSKISYDITDDKIIFFLTKKPIKIDDGYLVCAFCNNRYLKKNAIKMTCDNCGIDLIWDLAQTFNEQSKLMELIDHLNKVFNKHSVYPVSHAVLNEAFEFFTENQKAKIFQFLIQQMLEMKSIYENKILHLKNETNNEFIHLKDEMKCLQTKIEESKAEIEKGLQTKTEKLKIEIEESIRESLIKTNFGEIDLNKIIKKEVFECLKINKDINLNEIINRTTYTIERIIEILKYTADFQTVKLKSQQYSEYNQNSLLRNEITYKDSFEQIFGTLFDRYGISY